MYTTQHYVQIFSGHMDSSDEPKVRNWEMTVTLLHATIPNTSHLRLMGKSCIFKAGHLNVLHSKKCQLEED